MLFGKLKDRKGEIIYTVASIASPVLGMINSIIANRYIAPSDMGAIQSVLLIITYVNFLQLGVFNGLNRNIAYYKVQKKHVTVQKMVDTSYFVSKIIAITSFILGACYLTYLIICNRQPILIWGAVLLCIMLLFSPLTTHYDTTFRSGQEFKTLGFIKVKESVVYLVTTVLPVFWGYIGYIISQASKTIVGYILRREKEPFQYEHQQNLESYKELVRVGFPLLVSGYIWTLLMVVDQTYIVLYLGNEQLGLYTIARQCTAAFSVLPGAINSLLYPKAAACYGATGNVKSLKPFWWKSLILFIIVLVPTVLIGYFILPVFVDFVMPKYHGGIIVGQIALLSGLTYICNGPSVVFGTISKNMADIIVLTILFGLFWLILIVFHDFFSTIVDVAILRLIVLGIQMIFSLSLSYYYINRK
jgi:Membrane protein involved in the export of O-antigen and teichoic acid